MKTTTKSARVEAILSYYRDCFETACNSFRSVGTLDATTESELRSYYARLADRKAACVR